MRRTTAAVVAAIIGLFVLGAPSVAIASHKVKKTCTTTTRAIFAPAKGQAISYDVHHGTNTLDQQIPVTYSPCELTAEQPTVEILGLQPSTATAKATLEIIGGGRAYLHVVINAGQLSDGHQDLA